MSARQDLQEQMAKEAAMVFIDLMNLVGVEVGGSACLQAAATIVAASYATEVDDYAPSGGQILQKDPAWQGWAEITPWADVLEGWTPAGHDRCGCQVWTAPGVHDSPRSAVTHECGGHGPGGRLHIWTDNPQTGTPLDDEVLRGRRDFSKFQTLAWLYFDGNATAAMDAAGIGR